MGSFDPNLSAMVSTKYVGTSLMNGHPANDTACVTGFDQVGFVTATSSTVYNVCLTLSSSYLIELTFLAGFERIKGGYYRLGQQLLGRNALCVSACPVAGKHGLLRGHRVTYANLVQVPMPNETVALWPNVKLQSIFMYLHSLF